ncbi:MAG: cell division protein ZapA [Bacteroidia bacterium]|nr:cell division protein ZapA [Bacteroidia bacterium]
MMGQSVVIKIAGKEFPMKAASPEIEQMMRIAAEQINLKLADYSSTYPDKTLADKLAFVALREAVTRLSCMRRMEELDREVKEMTGETDRYLKSIEEK